MTPLEYLKEIVEPNVADLTADFSNLRHAFNAVHCVDALAAHIYYASGGRAEGRDDTAYREKLAKRSKSFALLRDIAKAIKHVHLDRGSPLVRRSHGVDVRSLGWGEGAFGEGRWGSPPQAVVTLDDGSVRVVEGVIASALNVLRAEMVKYGLEG